MPAVQLVTSTRAKGTIGDNKYEDVGVTEVLPCQGLEFSLQKCPLRYIRSTLTSNHGFRKADRVSIVVGKLSKQPWTPSPLRIIINQGNSSRSPNPSRIPPRLCPVRSDAKTGHPRR